MAIIAVLLLLLSDLSVCTGFVVPFIADVVEMEERRGITGRLPRYRFLPLHGRLAENTSTLGVVNGTQPNGDSRLQEPNPPLPVEENNQTNATDSSDTKHEDSRDENCGLSESIKAGLSIPGDGTHTLSLVITYDANDTKNDDKNITVYITAPEILISSSKNLSLHNEIIETIQFIMKPNVEESEIDANEIIQITISDNCTIEVPVPVDYLRTMFHQKDSQHSSSAAFANPMLHAMLLLFVLSLVSAIAWLCYMFCSRNHPVDTIRHQQLELIVPGSPSNLIEEAVDGWDETWDDDWDDAEAVKSSSLLGQSLSSRGLAARRGNKDGWDD